MNWNPLVLVGEVVRNIRCRLATWLLVGLTTSVVIGALALTELAAGSRALESRQRLDRAGSSVLIVEAPGGVGPTEAGINSGRCIALNGLQGIALAGAERVLSQVQLQKAPGLPVLPVEIVGPTVAIWDPDITNSALTSSGLWITKSLSERFGVKPGSVLQVADEPTSRAIAGSFDPVRSPDIGARFVFPGSASNRSDRCWIEVEGPIAQDTLVGLAAWFAADGPISVRPLLDPSELREDPAADYAARSTRYAWIAVGITIGTLLALLARSRRGEVALLRTLGASRLCAGGQVVAEGVAVSCLAWLLGSGAAVSVWRFAYDSAGRPESSIANTLTSTVMASSLSLTIYVVAVLAVSLGSRLQALKNRE